MYSTSFRLCCLLFCLLFASCSATHKVVQTHNQHQPGKRQFRGVWIQTAFQSEYQEMSVAQIKKELVRKLNYLQRCGINAIIFQVRPEADAFYASTIEPWSRFYTGRQGVAPEGNFDVMAFLIEACHQRNMEFHAWLNPYRASTAGNTVFADSHTYHTHPERFVVYNKQVLFDPGLPQNRAFIRRVVRDIVKRYDVDAIHMDDYFYPYPVAGMDFPDDESFRTYGLAKGFTQSQRADWRRANVNTLIKELKETINASKPWVRFGISPFGIYRNKKSTPDGSGSNTNGLQNYDDLYADVTYWVEQGWIDYTIPQIYWEIGHPAADYTTLVQWWDAHAHNRHLYVGQDVARTMKVDQLTPKMRQQQQASHVSGHCFWPANEIIWNNNGVADSLRANYHRYPALIPAYTHMHDRTPKAVKKMKVEFVANQTVLSWQAEQDPNDPEQAHYFVVYCFENKAKVDLRDPTKIVATTRNTYYPLPKRAKGERARYVVTAVDRFHNESRKGHAKNIKW